LINAYRTGAKEAIEAGRIITQAVKDRFELFFDYDEMPLVMNVVKESQADIKKQVFEKSCYLRIAVNIEFTAILLEQLEKFNGLKIEKIGTY
jgi:putative IMPACT (imprinted ancient) family translation regulator